MEWDLHFRSNNGREESLQALQEWTRVYHSSLDASVALRGRKLTQVPQIEDFVRAARFEDIRVEAIEIPTCAWSAGECTLVAEQPEQC